MLCYISRAIIDYEEQVLITSIKANIWCFFDYILQKEREFITRL